MSTTSTGTHRPKIVETELLFSIRQVVTEGKHLFLTPCPTPGHNLHQHNAPLTKVKANLLWKPCSPALRVCSPSGQLQRQLLVSYSQLKPITFSPLTPFSTRRKKKKSSKPEQLDRLDAVSLAAADQHHPSSRAESCFGHEKHGRRVTLTHRKCPSDRRTTRKSAHETRLPGRTPIPLTEETQTK